MLSGCGTKEPVNGERGSWDCNLYLIPHPWLSLGSKGSFLDKPQMEEEDQVDKGSKPG